MGFNSDTTNSVPVFNPFEGGKFLKDLLPEEAYIVALYAIGVPVHMFHFATAISEITGGADKGKFFNGKLFALAVSDRTNRDELSAFSIYPKQHSPSVFKDHPRVLELLTDSTKMSAIGKALIPHRLTFTEALRNPLFMSIDVNARVHWLLRAHDNNTSVVAKMLGDYILAENPSRPWDVDIVSLVGVKFAPFCPDLVGALSSEFHKYVSERGRVGNMSKNEIMKEIQAHHDSLTVLYSALGEQHGKSNY